MEKELLNNADDFISSANDNLEKGRYNPAVSDYFKAIVILCDYLIYKVRRVLPKNHGERFGILKIQFKDIYSLVLHCLKSI